MRKKINSIWMTICLLAFSSYLAMAQFTETREIEKRYKILPTTRIEITNKYGLIELNTWDKDSVYVKVVMKVEEKKLVKLEKTLDEIDVDFTNSQHYFIVRTLVGENRNQLENEFIKFKETLLQSDASVTITMKVWVPDKHELKIENKFGDILMGDYTGNVDITLSNGKLKAKDFPGKSVLNLSFASANMGRVENGRFTTNYSDVYIKESGQLRFESKSSTIEILQANALDINSRRDKYRIRLLDQIEADGNFSSFRVTNLEKQGKMRTSFGDVELENVNPGFDNIYIESRSTDINMYFDVKSKFNFEITETKSNLDLGREAKILDTIELDSKEKKNKHRCAFGEKPTGIDKVIINAVSGDINIMAN